MSTRDERVLQAVEERRKLVNEAIPERLPIEPPERLYEASRYLLDAGGKRLRPTILLLVAEAITETEPLSTGYTAFPDCSGDAIDIMSAAVSIEVIQSFTLIHDDIMDDDDLRRGVPAVHREYDLSTAILAGDTLYSKAFEYMLQTGAPSDRACQALDELATTCTEICEGQAMDVEFEEREDVDTDEYLRMVEHKTAVLYAAAAAIPAMLVGADQEVVEALHGYGLDIGCAFQIQDDVLDLTTPSEKLGKQRGSDLVENKKTLITVHARDHGVDVSELVDAGSAEEVTEAEIDAALEQLREAGSLDYARERAEELVEQGKSRLEVLPEGDARDMLCDIADFLIEREY